MSRPSSPACHLDALIAAKRLRAVTPTNEPVSLTDADCQEIDMTMHARKQPRPGNPLVDGYEADRQANAVRGELRSRRFS